MRFKQHAFASVILSALCLFLILPQSAEAQEFKKLTYKKPNRILVQYKDTQTLPNGKQLSRFGIVTLAPGETLKSRMAELRQDPSVLRVAPNYKRGMVEITPNDIKLAEQYSVSQEASANIDVTRAWPITKGKKKIKIAVIDTGVDLNHEDIKGKIWKNSADKKDDGIDNDGNGYVDDYRGWDFVHDNNNPTPDVCSNSSNSGISHGTHVAGIAAANTNNETGIAGIGWKTTIMALQVAQCDGAMTDSDIVEAVEYAVMMGADVINLSLGGVGESSIMEQAILDAQDAGVVVVAAAGNNGRNIDRIPFQPACIEGVITVSATDANDHYASFSNYGSGCVDVGAPGVNILSTIYNDPENPNYQENYAAYSGTSMSTPAVSGVVALLLAQDGSLTPSEVLNTLRNSAKDVNLPEAYGTGRIDALEALMSLDSVHEVHIKMFNNSDHDKRFKVGSRQKDKTPYFEWVVPRVYNADIAGYYMYFGTNPDANPLTDGVFQTGRSLAPAALASANEQTYVLKIAVQLTDDSLYGFQGSGTYILDNQVAAATLKSIALSNGKPQLKWKKSSDAHVSKYVIRRRLKNEDEFTKIASVKKDVTSFVDTSAESGKKYVYLIRTKDDLDNKKDSNEKNISL